MAEKTLEVRKPLQLETVSPVDLVICPTCRTVVSLAGIDSVETRPGERGLFSEPEGVKGVYCPNSGCGQRLYSEQSWTQHLVARRVAGSPPRDESEETS